VDVFRIKSNQLFQVGGAGILKIDLHVGGNLRPQRPNEHDIAGTRSQNDDQP